MTISVLLLTKRLQDVHEVLVSKAGTVADLYPALQKKASLSDEALQNLRFYEAHAGRIYKELTRDDKVTSFNEYVSVYAEQIPSEELEADASVDRAVYAFHFDKEPTKTHGVPFKFVIKPVNVSHRCWSWILTDDIAGREFQGYEGTSFKTYWDQGQAFGKGQIRHRREEFLFQT